MNDILVLPKETPTVLHNTSFISFTKSCLRNFMIKHLDRWKCINTFIFYFFIETKKPKNGWLQKIKPVQWQCQVMQMANVCLRGTLSSKTLL